MVVGGGFPGALPGGAVEAIAQPGLAGAGIEGVDGGLDLFCQRGPLRVVVDAGQQSKGGEPKGLDTDRITLTRGAGGVVGVHPGEVGGTVNEAAGGIHGDTVGGAADVALGEGNEDFADGAVAGGFGEEIVVLFPFHEVSDAHKKPQRGVRGVAVGVVVAPDHVGQGAVFLVAGEGLEDVTDGGEFSGGGNAPEADEGIAAPVKEPWIAGNNGEGVVAFDDELPDGVGGGEAAPRGVGRGGVGGGAGTEGGVKTSFKGGAVAGVESDAEIAWAEEIGVGAKAAGSVDRMFNRKSFGFFNEGGAGDADMETALQAGHEEFVRAGSDGLI